MAVLRGQGGSRGGGEVALGSLSHGVHLGFVYVEVKAPLAACRVEKVDDGLYVVGTSGLKKEVVNESM